MCQMTFRIFDQKIHCHSIFRMIFGKIFFIPYHGIYPLSLFFSPLSRFWWISSLKFNFLSGKICSSSFFNTISEDLISKFKMTSLGNDSLGFKEDKIFRKSWDSSTICVWLKHDLNNKFEKLFKKRTKSCPVKNVKYGWVFLDWTDDSFGKFEGKK